MAAFLFRYYSRFDAETANYEPPAVSPFADVSTSQVFYREMAWMYEMGISNGWWAPGGKGTFGWDQPVLRDSMAAFLFRIAARLEPSINSYVPPATSRFADVPPSHVFYREISWLADAGISLGWDNGDGTRTYGIDRSALRDAMAAFLYRLNNTLGGTP